MPKGILRQAIDDVLAHKEWRSSTIRRRLVEALEDLSNDYQDDEVSARVSPADRFRHRSNTELVLQMRRRDKQLTSKLREALNKEDGGLVGLIQHAIDLLQDIDRPERSSSL